MAQNLQAADKCIEQAPTFAKAYSRKGTLQFFMKDYEKALETYQKGLEHEPDNMELKEGIERCIASISRWGQLGSNDQVHWKHLISISRLTSAWFKLSPILNDLFLTSHTSK